MKISISILLLFIFFYQINAQKKAEAEQLVTEGIKFHDKGDYQAAISLYDRALALDKDNLYALGEKAFSLLMIGNQDECITCCKKAIKVHKGSDRLNNVYVCYGNALDEKGEAEKALKVYDDGIKQFPEFYQLYFNKGITLTGMKEPEKAEKNFQQALLLNPNHPGSHSALARVLMKQNKRIPAIFAFSRFFTLEPDSKRAKENLGYFQNLMKGDVQKKNDQSVTININSSALDIDKNGKSKENNFTTSDLLLSFEAALDYDKKYADKTEIEKFIRKFNSLCASLNNSAKDNYGFYWEYYAPYFVAMKDKEMIGTFAYLAFATSGFDDVNAWINSHSDEIDKFFQWSEGFEWKK